VKEVLDNALMGSEAANFEFPLFTKDQKRVEVLLNATTRRDVSGYVVGVIGVGQDITERKQVEKKRKHELRRSCRLSSTQRTRRSSVLMLRAL
jgi:PAS domain S-box-containing protein